MTLPRTYIDGFLVEWEEGEYQAQVKSMRQKSEAINIFVRLPGAGASMAGRGDGIIARRAQAVRERLARTVQNVPEVMVKITSSCRGMGQIGRHIDYISRKGLIDLEDQDGLIVRGKDRLKDLKDEWRTGGPEDIADVTDRRDTVNIVFSMPAHTEEISMKRAVRAFATVEFKGHQYVFAYHTPATDPDPNPPSHPHVHLSVKTLSWSGHRLNPRKADLQRWREGFAAQLRAHGIDANATSRLARLQKDRGDKQSVHAIKVKGEALHSIGKGANKTRISKAKQLEKARRDYYRALTEVLQNSDDIADRLLAAELEKHFELDPISPPEQSLPERDR